MRPLRALIIYVGVVFLGGALLAPWLHFIVQSLAGWFPDLANAPFHRYVNRSLLLLAILGLWPLLRSLGAISSADLGLTKPAGQGGRLGQGFLLGFLSLAIMAALAFASGARVLDEVSPGKLAQRLVDASLTAIVVAVLEEILFRGGIYGGLRRVSSASTALIVSSFIYALVHFFTPARHQGEITWMSGLALLPGMFSGFGEWNALMPGFLNLTIAGALLALAYERTGNLYYSIGLHAGWIFWLATYRSLTSSPPHTNLWFWGSKRMIDGWLALVVLSLCFIAFACFHPRTKTNVP